MRTVQHILIDHELRNTSVRKEVLQLFLHKEIALSQPEIEHELDDSCDRVTIYRTLATFLEKGVIHKVLDDQGAMKYALCADTCSAEVHQHDHLHFKCTHCGTTQCIEEAVIPSIQLPAGFQLAELNVLAQGTCPDCGGK